MISFFSTLFYYHLEIITALIATITYKWYSYTPFKYFLHFLWVTVFIESLGMIPVVHHFHPDNQLFAKLKESFLSDILLNNNWVYNLYYLFYFPFYILIYRKLIISKYLYKIINIMLFVYVIISFIDAILNINQFNLVLLRASLVNGTVFLLITVCFYLFRILNSNDIFKFHLTLPFWITIGTLFFNLVTAPIYIFRNLESKSRLYDQYYLLIHEISNYILYGSFIIGFIVNAYQEKKKLNEVNTD